MFELRIATLPFFCRPQIVQEYGNSVSFLHATYCQPPTCLRAVEPLLHWRKMFEPVNPVFGMYNKHYKYAIYPDWRISPLPIAVSSQGHPRWSPWALCVISVMSNIVTFAVVDIFHVKKYDVDFLTPQGHPRSNLTVPVESQSVLRVSAAGGPTSHMSPFSRYFKSKDCDLDL